MKNSSRVLILVAAYGAGHIQAGLALKSGLARIRPEWESKVCNFIHLINSTFDRYSQDFHISVVRRFPSCYSFFYHITDKPLSWPDRVYNRLGSKILQELIQDYNPQVIVATFPIPGRMAASLRLQGKLKSPVVMVITDHTAHAQWIHPGIDLYLVADEEVKNYMIKKGADPHKIEVSGIPINLGLLEIPETKAAKECLEINDSQPTVLLVGGGNSRAAAMEEMCIALSRIQMSLQVLVIVGKDEQYLKTLSLRFKNNPSFRFYGFVDDMEKYLAAADLLVSKAGALTLAEAAAAGVPTIIYRCLPGQERANAFYYTRRGAALQASDPETLTALAGKVLLNEQGIADRLSQTIQATARPYAALDAAEAIVKLVEQNNKELLTDEQ